jgi:hypothetical protein
MPRKQNTNKKTNPNAGKSIFQIERELLEKAKNMTDLVTPEKTIKGWVWVTMGKTCKQVSPENLESYISDGWKLSNKK